MDVLDVPDWNVKRCIESELQYTVYADYTANPPGCRLCGATADNLIEHDRRKKKIRDFPVRAKPTLVILRVARHRCLVCGAIATQKIGDLASGTKVTARFAGYIIRQCVVKDFSLVGRESGISLTTVNEIFVRFMERNEDKMMVPLPRVLGLDGVYIDNRDRCIMTDIENKRLIGLYEKMTEYDVGRYLLDSPGKENVEVVTMDMSRALRNAVERFLPWAVIVIDKYHVQRKVKEAVDNFLKSLSPPDGKTGKQYRRNRFLLYARLHNLDESQREQLDAWNRDVPQIMEVCRLKEEFMNIWQFSSRADAERAFSKWKNGIPPHLKFVFSEIITSFSNWGTFIFNYFDHRYTNAFTESTNRRIKMIQKQSCGCGFWIVRARMLCREYLKRGGKDESSAACNEDYRYIRPTVNQRSLRLKQSYESNSQLFIAMFPPAAWRNRFGPHLKLLMTKTRPGDSGNEQRPRRKRVTRKRK